MCEGLDQNILVNGGLVIWKLIWFYFVSDNVTFHLSVNKQQINMLLKYTVENELSFHQRTSGLKYHLNVYKEDFPWHTNGPQHSGWESMDYCMFKINK